MAHDEMFLFIKTKSKSKTLRPKILLASSRKLINLRNTLPTVKKEPKVSQQQVNKSTVSEPKNVLLALNQHPRETHVESMDTIECRSLSSIPSHIQHNKTGDKKNIHKEMARFYSQQLCSSQLLAGKFTQPLSMWAKSRDEYGHHQNDIVHLLTQLKGVTWRQQQLQYQMPGHDVELFRRPTAEGRFLRSKQRKALVKSELFLFMQSNSAAVCQKCSATINANVACVRITLPSSFTSKADVNPITVQSGNAHHHYHIECFTCFDCHQILVDLKAYVHQKGVPSDGTIMSYNLFCARHFVEIFKPRCPYCDHLILDEECTEAEGKAWHVGHFCCTECKRSLGGQQYIMAASDSKKETVHQVSNNKCSTFPPGQSKQLPYCLTCFDILFGELCEECGELIACEVGAIIHEGRSWHATDNCFRCSLCLKSLLGKQFLPALDGRIYCSLTCSQAMISHQKERLRRQNKLHTLNGQKKHPILNQSTTSGQVLTSNVPQTTPLVTSGDSQFTTANHSIKQRKDDFLKSMTLDRYEQRMKSRFNEVENIKVLNLSQLRNYEQFIKQNRQYFTSKYDWSKEQEFLDTIDSSNEMTSSQTTTTLSDHNSEENNLVQNLTIKCEIASSRGSDCLERSPTTDAVVTRHKKVWPIPIEDSQTGHSEQSKIVTNNSQWMDHRMTHLAKTTQPSISSHNLDIKLKLMESTNVYTSPQTVDSTSRYYFGEKSSSLNSPSSSNGTAPIWTISPPPEYSKLEEFKDESSSNSSSQALPLKNGAKVNGILKINYNRTQESNFSEQKPSSMEIQCNSSIIKNEQTASNPIDNNSENTLYLQSTPIIQVEKSLGEYSKGTDALQQVTSPIRNNAKSVSFDPNIEDKDEKSTRSVRTLHRLRSQYHEHHQCSQDFDPCDSHSCSSCSTCSTSSSDDDEDSFDIDLANLVSNNELVRTTTSRNDHSTSQTQDGCVIS